MLALAALLCTRLVGAFRFVASKSEFLALSDRFRPFSTPTLAAKLIMAVGERQQSERPKMVGGVSDGVFKSGPSPTIAAHAVRVLPSQDADIESYAAWAAGIAAEDSTIDSDGLLSATHATHSMLRRFAEGEGSIPASFNSTAAIHLDRLTFVEYHDVRSGGGLAGLLVADVEDNPVRIHRVLVAQEYRSGGARRRSPSVMSELGHALITHVICRRSRGELPPPERVDFTLANVACVMAHTPKWTRIFETYPERARGTTQVVASADHKQSPIFVWWPTARSPLDDAAPPLQTAGFAALGEGLSKQSARVAPSPTRIICQVL